MGNPIPWL
jgi:hypothetical protein